MKPVSSVDRAAIEALTEVQTAYKWMRSHGLDGDRLLPAFGAVAALARRNAPTPRRDRSRARRMRGFLLAYLGAAACTIRVVVRWFR